MITLSVPALMALATLITSLSTLIWSIRRRAWVHPAVQRRSARANRRWYVVSSLDLNHKKSRPLWCGRWLGNIRLAL